MAKKQDIVALRSEIEERIKKAFSHESPKLLSLTAIYNTKSEKRKIIFKDKLKELTAQGYLLPLKLGNRILYLSTAALRAVLSQLPSPEGSAPPPEVATTTKSLGIQVAYDALKFAQGGFSAVLISDLQRKMGIPLHDLHHALMEEVQAGRASLHRATSPNFPEEVWGSAIRLPGESEPYITVTMP